MRLSGRCEGFDGASLGVSTIGVSTGAAAVSTIGGGVGALVSTAGAGALTCAICVAGAALDVRGRLCQRLPIEIAAIASAPIVMPTQTSTLDLRCGTGRSIAST